MQGSRFSFLPTKAWPWNGSGYNVSGTQLGLSVSSQKWMTHCLCGAWEEGGREGGEGGEGGRNGEREGGMEGGRKGEREKGREGGREGGMEGGRKGEREGGRERGW